MAFDGNNKRRKSLDNSNSDSGNEDGKPKRKHTSRAQERPRSTLEFELQASGINNSLVNGMFLKASTSSATNDLIDVTAADSLEQVIKIINTHHLNSGQEPLNIIPVETIPDEHISSEQKPRPSSFVLSVEGTGVNRSLVNGMFVAASTSSANKDIIDVTAANNVEEVISIINKHIDKDPLELVLHESPLANMNETTPESIDQNLLESPIFDIPFESTETRIENLALIETINSQILFKIPTGFAPQSRKGCKRDEPPQLTDDELLSMLSLLTPRDETLSVEDEIRTILRDYFSFYGQANPAVPTKKQKLEGDLVAYSSQMDLGIDANFLVWYRANFPLECEACELRFVNQGDLWVHLEVDHRAKYWCYLCAVFFENALIFMQHLSNHRGTDRVEKYTCSLCNTDFYSKYFLRQHLKKTHDCVIFPE